jgi:sugar (pentulose or hexulose) kinase
MARAVLEGVAFAIREHLDTMSQAGAPITEIRVSGGGARSALWTRIKADVTGIPTLSMASDATSLGVALVAGTSVGLFSSVADAVERCVRITQTFEPDTRVQAHYDERYHRFRELARVTAEGPTSMWAASPP